MICPYCNEELIKGYIQNKYQIFWSEKKRKIFTIPEKGDITLSPGTLGIHSVESYCCPKCKKIIVEYDDSQISIV